MKNILFVNNTKANCGIYQYGKRVYNAISQSSINTFTYLECSKREDVTKTIKESACNYDAVIYNYCASTLPFVDASLIEKHYHLPHIAILHEVTHSKLKDPQNFFFDYLVYGDPSIQEMPPRLFKSSRIIAPYQSNQPAPVIPTIGCYGFAVKTKNYKRLIRLVHKEFDEAIIRINIASNSVSDKEGQKAQLLAEKCKKHIKKNRIKLEFSFEFFTNQKLLDFLSSNSINVFPYKFSHKNSGGISSAIDQALASKRPIALTLSDLFRHVLDVQPSLFVPRNAFEKYALKLLRFLPPYNRMKLPNNFSFSTLKQIIENGSKPTDSLRNSWTTQTIVKEYDNAIEQILSSFKKGKKKNFPLNRILDNSAREKYKEVIKKLHELSPEIIKRKIPRANVQQAFVFQTVRHYIQPKSKVLCVGSFEDTAYEGLKKIGHEMEAIDPVTNYDLDTFFQLPSTIKGSYDIIFSTSVVEHVEDDQKFFSHISELLAPNGVAILTCDFKDQYKVGDYIFPGNFRFYTQSDLKNRILPILKDCTLVDNPSWDCKRPDFKFGRQTYTFATIVFQKQLKEDSMMVTS